MRRPLVLLLLVGLLPAVNINLGKAVMNGGVSPLVTALASTAGAGVVLLGVALLVRRPLSLEPRRFLFYGVAGGVSYALPNALVFAAADRVGPAYASILHAFVPVLTYLIAIEWSLDRPTARRVAGVFVGLSGAVLVIVARLGFSTRGETSWLLLTLIAPLSIAFGNVLRSRFWPPDAQPLDLAPGMLLAAGVQLGLLILVQPSESLPASSVQGWLLAAQVAVSAVFYGFYFKLQHVAGPVYLSQIGYVATAFGLLIAVLAFRDRVTLPMLAGASLVVVGVLLTRPTGSDKTRASSRVLQRSEPA